VGRQTAVCPNCGEELVLTPVPGREWRVHGICSKTGFAVIETDAQVEQVEPSEKSAAKARAKRFKDDLVKGDD